jgi:class 3 adenylate cyclase/tetratricopeptide (TPR) repeat protein
MKCPSCQSNNPQSAKFCVECGNKFESICPKCGISNSSAFKFCYACGADLKSLKETISIDYSRPHSYTPKFLADKILTTRSSIEGERKLVTVLFADVANYTSIAEKLDPEEIHQMMDECFKILMDEIHKYEGTINQFTGDGVMALFGAPVAHEDHAQRACYAALSIQKALEVFEEKIKNDFGAHFKMRIGLNSGPVVVGSIGDDLRMDYTAVGDTTNLASRIENMARPGASLVSSHTHKLARDFFEFKSLGKIEVKGKEEPQGAYELLKAGRVETRIEAAAAKGLTRFVGRKNSFARLKEALEDVVAGSGQVAAIVGEAGVGKSRLLLEFKNLLLQSGYAYLEGQCFHFGGSMSYLPFLDILRSYFEIKEGDRELTIKQKMTDKITELDEKLESALPPLRDLLSLKVEDEDFIKLVPQQKRERTFEALRNLLIRVSQDRPLILIIEDMHWIDKTSEEFIDYLIRWLAGFHILLILLYRPEYTHPWGSKTFYRKIGLKQLTVQSSAELVQAILEDGDVSPEIRELILHRAAGNPLFMEEFTHTLLENGYIQREDKQYILSRKSSDIQVPDTIQGVIAARMDRLEDNLKRTMQVASVIGRDFAFRILQTITGLREELKGYLIDLQGLELIYEKSLFPELEYIFKHALTREVAYNSLLQKNRNEIHKKIGNAIEQIYAERLEEFFVMLAYHFEQGEVWEKALEYTLEAAERAKNLYAQPEAISHYLQALELLEHFPRTVERANTHINVVLSLVRLPASLIAGIVGGMEEGLLRHIDEAMHAADDIGDAARLAGLESTKGFFSFDENLLTRAIARAETTGNALVRAHTANLYGNYLGMIGQYGKAVPHVGKAIEILGTEGERYEQAYAMAVGGRCFCARAGKLEEALSYAAGAREIGEAMDNAMLKAWGAMEAEPYMYNGLWKQVVRVAEEGLPVAWEIGEWMVIFFSSSWLGIAYLKLGRLEDAKRVLERALKESQERSFWPFLITYLQIPIAHLHLSLGEYDKALGAARKALELAESNHFYLEQGAANRVLGQIHEAMGSREEADAAFRHSMQVLEGIQSRPELAQALLAYGRFKAAGDVPAGGKTIIERALRLFEEMGATGWIDEARAAL